MPLLDLFWTMLMIFLWIAWIWVLIMVISDIFRDHTTSGWGKGFWILFVVAIPWLGVLVYLIAKGDDMTKRRLDDAKQADEATRAYIREASGSSSSVADELSKLAALRDNGTISEDEFQTQKAGLLA